MRPQQAIPLVLAQQWDSDLAEKYGVLSTSDGGSTTHDCKRVA